MDAKPNSYVTAGGEKLEHLADKLLGDANRWREIYAMNKLKIGPHPERILAAGIFLVLPVDHRRQ